MKKNALLILLTIFLVNNVSSQDNPCLPMLQDGLYKIITKESAFDMNEDLKSYFESATFKEDFKNSKWNLGIDGVIPVGDSGLMQEIGLDLGSSDVKINEFQQKIKDAKSIQINKNFYDKALSAIPDANLASEYRMCVGDWIERTNQEGFRIKKIYKTDDFVTFSINYRKKFDSDPTPKVVSFEILGAKEITQGLNVGQTINNEFNISCSREIGAKLILSIVTTRENLVQVVEGEKIGFDKTLPIGTIIASSLDWDSFHMIVEDKSSSAWVADKSKWSPADGRSVNGSDYAKKSKKNKVPDLRGIFLRGLNSFDPFYSLKPTNPNQLNPINTSVEEYQDDAIRNIKGSFLGTNPNQTAEGAFNTSAINVADKNEWGHAPGVKYTFDASKADGVNVSKENRPKNVSIFYYIKIN